MDIKIAQNKQLNILDHSGEDIISINDNGYVWFNQLEQIETNAASIYYAQGDEGVDDLTSEEITSIIQGNYIAVRDDISNTKWIVGKTDGSNFTLFNLDADSNIYAKKWVKSNNVWTHDQDYERVGFDGVLEAKYSSGSYKVFVPTGTKSGVYKLKEVQTTLFGTGIAVVIDQGNDSCSLYCYIRSSTYSGQGFFNSDITVTIENTGTKLYRHMIRVNNKNVMSFINTSSSAYTAGNIDSINDRIKIINPTVYSEEGEWAPAIYYYITATNLGATLWIDEELSFVRETFSISGFTDTVTNF